MNGGHPTKTARTYLQAARIASGWTQPRLMVAMRSAAPGLGLHLPDDPSLKSQLTRWENGRQAPGREYQALFRLVYGMTDEELGFPAASESEESIPVYIPALSSDSLAYAGVLLEAHIQADNLLGPHLVIPVVEQQAAQLRAAAREARGPMRRSIVEMAFRYHEFLGWLMQDAGRHDAAMVNTARAQDLAVELRDPILSAYVLMRRSNIASDADDPGLAVALTEAALTDSAALPPKVLALVLRQQANAHAGLGDDVAAASSIDRAFDVVARQDSDGSALAAYCTEPYVAMEAGTSWLTLGQHDRALEAFTWGGDAWPEALRRDRGLALARRATAHAAQGDVDQACSVGALAVGICRETGSARTLRELRRLRTFLRPLHREHPGAAQMHSAVASLMSGTAA
jgi:transcriptional regulator with XRE-family HTH domain